MVKNIKEIMDILIFKDILYHTSKSIQKFQSLKYLSSILNKFSRKSLMIVQYVDIFSIFILFQLSWLYYKATPEPLRIKREELKLKWKSINKVEVIFSKQLDLCYKGSESYQIDFKPSHSFWINLISFRTFRDSLLHKQETS